MKRLLLATILLFVSRPLLADSYTLNNFLVSEDYRIIITPMVPGVDITLGAYHVPGEGKFFSQLSFLMVFNSPTTISSLTWTLTLPSPAAPMVMSIDPTSCGPDCGGTFVIPTPPYYQQLNAASLAVNLNGAVQTYPFHFGIIIPEPTSLVLLGTGLVGVAWRKYRGRTSRLAAASIRWIRSARG